jgi:hypothetical protein
MIKKELDPFVADDKYAAAGRKAEEQMAFYLKRFFASSPDVFVLNGIRLERDGDAAQMDHLVLHRYGVIVVESKSVAGKVQIKDDGQWIRWYGKESSGMASPVTQAKLQVRFMRDYLNLAAKPKGIFDRYAFDVQVAISDSGVILWPATGSLPEVCKADQVAERIESRVAELAKMPDAPVPMTSEHLSKIADFLCTAHKPLHLRAAESLSSKYVQAAVEKQIAAVQGVMEIASQSASRLYENMMAVQQAAAQRNESEKKPIVPPVVSASTTDEVHASVPSCEKHRLIGSVCKHCSSDDVSIHYKHNYYYYCNACNKSSPLKSVCSSCGEIEIPHKKGKEFFLECRLCKTNRLFHVNG